MRRPVSSWGIRLGKGSFWLCVGDGWGLLEVTETRKFPDRSLADKVLKGVQKHFPAATVEAL